MEFDLEYKLENFRKEQHELFDENGNRYTGVPLSNRTAEMMLELINELESALAKAETKEEQLTIPVSNSNLFLTQEQINTLYNLTILIHEHEWFGKRKKPRDREEVQEWVAKKLASCMDIYTTPCGMSWSILCSKEYFEEYWNKHSKIKDLPYYYC